MYNVIVVVKGVSSGIEIGYFAAQTVINHTAAPADAINDYNKETRLLREYMER